MSPADFIPIAEASGLITSITRFVLHEACRQLREWQTDWPAASSLSVSVNIPAKYLTKESQVEEIIAIIAESGLRSRSIRLEITETQLMENAENIANGLLRLSNSGARVYIDDFGTGFSSLSYLSTFPVEALKIDQSFVRSMGGNEKNSAIVRSINSLGHNLGIDVIAEGIETQAQLTYLRTIKCQFGQGYFFARPLTPGKVGESLSTWFPDDGAKALMASRLRAFELFAELNEEDLLEIAQTCEEIRVRSGNVIIHEGQIGDFAYLMEEGAVGIYRGASDNPDFFALLEAPAVFGEMALANPEGIRAASVKATRDLRLLTVPIIPCLSSLRRFPVFKKNLIDLVAERSAR